MPEELEEIRSYSPKEVAEIFNVHTRSVARWAARGKVAFFVTPGGRRRYYADPIDAMTRTTNDEDKQP